jgi:dynein heavy chain
MFPTQGIQYSQVCGRIIGYQIGQPQAFFLENTDRLQMIDGSYVDGVSLTYGSPRQHIWTFANALDELGYGNDYSRCSCTDSSRPNTPPSFVGNDYFCETGVPPGQQFNNEIFYADDPLWDGQGCGPTSTCCTFNNPPWFCKQLPQSTSADLEIRLCSRSPAAVENTPTELIEIYVK